MKNTYYKSGVYALKAVERNQIYIGSTKCFKTRKNLHMTALRKADTKRCITSFLDSYIKGELIEFEIIEICDNYLEREQYWIDFYKSHPSLKIVNVFSADRSNSIIPNVFKSKMSSILKHRWKDEKYRNFTLNRLKKTEYKKGCKSFRCKITIAKLSDGTIHEFTSAKLASENFGFNSNNVVNYIRRNKPYKGIKFYYK